MNAGLSNLGTLKAQLLAASMAATEIRYDSVILAIGLGMAGLVETYCGRKLCRQVGAQETFSANRASFILSRFPLEAVSLLEVKTCETDGFVAQDASVIQIVNEASGIVTTDPACDLGPERAQVRVTFTGGYWWEQLDRGDASFPSTQPDGSYLLPDALRLAWLLQCETVWASRDKLGLGIGDKPNEQSAINDLKLSPLVRQMLQPYVRMSFV